MDIDITIGGETLNLHIENPHRFDVGQVMNSINELGKQFGADLVPLQINRLIPKMIRGVAGCEGGCPSDAKGLVRDGFGNFELSYVEGGILSAVCMLENGKDLTVKVFPDFN
jgi:hypothetical protein